MNSASPPKRKSRRERKLADEFDKFFDLLVYQTHDVHQFFLLFDEDERRYELLESTAPGFFDDLFMLYIHRIVINMRKVVEHRDDCLTVHRMHMLASDRPNYDVARGQALIDRLEQLADVAKEWRDNVCVHADLHVTLGKSEVRKFFPQQAREFYDEVMQEFIDLVGDGVHPLKSSPSSRGDALELLRTLRDGRALRLLLKKNPILYREIVADSRTTSGDNNG